MAFAVLTGTFSQLLEDLGVPAEPFIKLQRAATKGIRKSRSTLRSATKLVQEWGLGTSTGITSTLPFLLNNPATATAAFSNPFISALLDATTLHAIREIKHSARIPLPQDCFNLVGVLDHSGVLEEGQIYARIERQGTTTYVQGTIAISRSPTNHVGDLQLVNAVGKLPSGVGERFRGLKNCVVFSSKGTSLVLFPSSFSALTVFLYFSSLAGERSLPSMLGGGDLDGDCYLLLSPISGLIPHTTAEPANYDPSPVVKLEGREATVKDTAEFFFEYLLRDRTGLVATRCVDLFPCFCSLLDEKLWFAGRQI
jgi:RNA-dependent RNA polymerase